MPSIRGNVAMQLVSWTVAATLVPLTSGADPIPDNWQWDATMYVWLPSLGGETSFPPGGGGPSIDVESDALLDSINFAFMGTLGARKGPWGIATDVIYLDLGASQEAMRNFELGQVDLPAGVDADLRLDVTGWLWTTTGSYSVIANDRVLLDVLGGARMLDLEEQLRWEFNGDIASLPLPGRSGTTKARATNWDAIVGVRGRATFREDSEWFMPYLLDVGAGESDLTWQAMMGVGYTFVNVEVKGVWRYLDYDMGDGTPIQSLEFNGPAVGFTYRF